MAVQTTTTTANRSHNVEGLNGFVSMRTSIAFRRGGPACRISANQAVGLLTGESGFFGSGVTWWISCGLSLFTVETCPHWEQRYTRWTVRDRGHGWGDAFSHRRSSPDRSPHRAEGPVRKHR